MISPDQFSDAFAASTDLASIGEQLGLSIDDLRRLLSSSFRHMYPQGYCSASHEAAYNSDDSGYESDAARTDPFEAILGSADLDFSDEQVAFMKAAVLERRNLALLAPAGYGKSATLTTTIRLFHHIVKQRTQQEFMEIYNVSANIAGTMHNTPVVALCASTGKAASLLHTRTMHSLLGIGLGRGEADAWYKRVLKSNARTGIIEKLRALHCIIIDEISMVGATMLDKISAFLQMVRKSADHFGGLQMIFVGDFAQLPPINDLMAFESSEYRAANILQVQLTRCFRQSDPLFRNILSELRFGSVSDDAMATLVDQTDIDPEYAAGMQPTMLCSTNAEVDVINERELKGLCERTKCRVQSYPIHVSQNVSATKAESFRKAENIPAKVELAVGTQVMVTFNVAPPTVINGTQGVVTELLSNAVRIRRRDGGVSTIDYIAFKDPDDDDVFDARALFTYMPLRLGFALSIHKSQGTTMQLMEVDCRRIFACGQLYVAISRCSSLDGLIVKNLTPAAVKCDRRVKEFYGIDS